MNKGPLEMHVEGDNQKYDLRKLGTLMATKHANIEGMRPE